MKSLIFVLFFLVCSICWGSIDSYPVAKISSGIASAPPSMFGSGIIFRFNNELYVLTSDHVLIRDNSKMSKHAVKFDGGLFAADYIMSDWARRFAILKLKNVPIQTLNDLRISDLQNLITPYNGSSKYVLIGYPANSQSLQESNVGTWMQITMSTLISFGYSSYLMSKNTLAEFGMSGGPVFEDLPSGAKLLGLLSYQIYKPGQDKIDEISPGTILNGDYTIVVPGVEIKNVIEEVLAGGQSDLWNFEEFASSNAKVNEVVGTGHLILSAAMDSVQQRMTSFEISYSSNIKNQTVRYKDSDGLFDSFEKTLKINPSSSLNVIGYRLKTYGVQNYQWREIEANSLAQALVFITIWGEPVTLIGTPDPKQIEIDATIFATRINNLSCTFKTGGNMSAHASVQDLCKGIGALQAALMDHNILNPQWCAIKPSDIAKLLNDDSITWQNVKDGLTLKSLLMEIKTYFSAITL